MKRNGFVLAAVLLALALLAGCGQEETTDPAPTEEPSTVQEEPSGSAQAEESSDAQAEDSSGAQAAYDLVIEDYQSFYISTRGMDDVDYMDWMDNYYGVYHTSHPYVGEGYLEFFNTQDHFYSAYHDLDDNGTEELLVGVMAGNAETPRVIAVYLYDGEKAVMADTFYWEVLGDGTFLETGNGYVSGRVQEIGSDGYTLEDVTDSDIPQGQGVDTLDLSAHGDFLAPTLEWTLITP